MSTAERFIIRPADKHDCKQIFTLVQEFIAEFNQPPSKLTAQDLEVDGFESEVPSFQCLVIQDKVADCVCGYALFYLMYSVRVGKLMWLEDIFISSSCRGLDLGNRLFAAVANEAHTLKCSRIDFSVYKWNPAVKFYLKMGAQNISQSEKWNLWRLDSDNIAKLALH